MRKYARALVYIVVAFLGGVIIFTQLFPTFEKKTSTYLLLVLGVILLIDGIRSFIRFIRNL